MEDLPSYFDLILSRQAFLWMPRTLDLCKVFDLIPYDNLNWYDTPSLWQMLKGLKNDKHVGLNAVLSRNSVRLVQPWRNCWPGPTTSLLLAWGNVLSDVSRFRVSG